MVSRRLVHAVDVRGPHQVLLVDREVVRPYISMPAKTSHVAVVAAARLEDRQLRTAIDLEIRVRIAHRVDVADLPREVEDHILVADQGFHRGLHPHVCDVQPEPQAMSWML